GTGELLIARRPEPTDPAAAAARVSRALGGGGVAAVDGTVLDIAFDSICVHSDLPNALAVATAVRAALGDQR
ncbi:MAG: LamB/YcsF family protein, partial [Streptosporangiaceae bacterium]